MQILVVDDEKNIRESTVFALEAEGHYAESVDCGRLATLRLAEEEFEFVLLDLRLGDEDGLEVLQQIHKRHPNIIVAVFTAYASVDTAVKAMKMGAFDYLEKPFTPEQLRGVIVRAEKHRQMRTQIEVLKDQVSAQGPDPRFSSADPSMHQTFEILFRAAATPASILILGESGTGKSMVARAVHERSHLKDKPFVTISCPSLSKELLESELFGHVKGSFTGAIRDKWGKVHAAHGGTLFLDEIGELPLDIQPKLLRLLQEKEYERLGENKTRTAEVRVIAATNANLRHHVDEGKFREDLYYRLNVIAVEMPPLRNRKADLLEFAEDYLKYFAKQSGRPVRGFNKEALAWISSYRWPGNLRELRNALERAVILSRDTELKREDFPDTLEHVEPAGPNGQISLSPGGDTTLEQLEEEHIRRVLSRTPTMQEAARTLGIDQATLYRKRKKMGMD